MGFKNWKLAGSLTNIQDFLDSNSLLCFYFRSSRSLNIQLDETWERRLLTLILNMFKVSYVSVINCQVFYIWNKSNGEHD